MQSLRNILPCWPSARVKTLRNWIRIKVRLIRHNNNLKWKKLCRWIWQSFFLFWLEWMLHSDSNCAEQWFITKRAAFSPSPSRIGFYWIDVGRYDHRTRCRLFSEIHPDELVYFRRILIAKAFCLIPLLKRTVPKTSPRMYKQRSLHRRLAMQASLRILGR